MPTAAYALIILLGCLLALRANVNPTRHRSVAQLSGQFLVIVGYYVAVFHFLPPAEKPVGKGPEDDLHFWVQILAIFTCIVAGMLAEAFYNWLDKEKVERSKGTDYLGMVKPLFAAPLILIPTVGAFQNANIDFTKSQYRFPWLLILLTAFEKGFLWRHYLAKRTAEVAKEAAPSPN